MSLCRCANCSHECDSDDVDLAEIPDLWDRLDPGSEVPAGECPECGALTYLVENPDAKCSQRAFPKGTTYRIVKIELLVPTGAEDYMDLLSDFRDDHPDELVQWGHAPNHVEGLSRVAAIASWACLHPDDSIVTIKEDA